MTAEQQFAYLHEQVLPRLSEGGVEAFVLTGYLRTADGNLRRVCIANAAKNPAFEDGLRPLIHAAHIWGAQPAVSGRHVDEPPSQSEPTG